MTNAIGWHQDENEPTISRYWDGTSWRGLLRWDGAAWVAQEPEAPAASPAASAAIPADLIATHVQKIAAPVPTASELPATPIRPPAARPVAEAEQAVAATFAGMAPSAGFAMTRTSWALLGSAGIAAVGIALPWEKVSSPYQNITQTPISNGGGAFILLGLLAGVVALALPSRFRQLSLSRTAGIAVIAGLMTLLVVAKFHSVGVDQGHLGQAAAESDNSSAALYGYDTSSMPTLSAGEATAGLGLYLWVVSLAGLWYGVVRSLQSLVRSASGRGDDAPRA